MAETRFSKTVSFLNSLANWNVRIMPAFARSFEGIEVMSRPSDSDLRPLVGARVPGEHGGRHGRYHRRQLGPMSSGESVC